MCGWCVGWVWGGGGGGGGWGGRGGGGGGVGGVVGGVRVVGGRGWVRVRVVTGEAVPAATLASHWRAGEGQISTMISTMVIIISTMVIIVIRGLLPGCSYLRRLRTGVWQRSGM